MQLIDEGQHHPVVAWTGMNQGIEFEQHVAV
jgi:hypothetical protein